PGGMAGLCHDISSLIARQKRRKTVNEALVTTLTRDLEKYENGLNNPASDRYMALIYPEMATAMDYIPENALVAICDQASIRRSAIARCDEMGMALDGMLQGGLLAGELCDFVSTWDDFCYQLEGRTADVIDEHIFIRGQELRRGVALIDVEDLLPCEVEDLDAVVSDNDKTVAVHAETDDGLGIAVDDGIGGRGFFRLSGIDIAQKITEIFHGDLIAVDGEHDSDEDDHHAKQQKRHDAEPFRDPEIIRRAEVFGLCVFFIGHGKAPFVE
ncbi:MAG: hypothetical protein J6S41_00155, partial [Clostridia bacterium]|nr:hypothetical protein [Clostridia bacterium]